MTSPETIVNHLGRDISPVPIEDGRRYLIPLTPFGFATVDVSDLEIVKNISWTRTPTVDGKVYARGNVRDASGSWKVISMHRLIMGTTDPDIEIDHVRREETLNNTRDNLREADHGEQARHSKVKSNSLTGIKGVHFHKTSGLYFAYIRHGGKRVSLGYYKTSEEAARVRDRAAIKLHGRFASLNFPLSDYEEVQSAHEVA